MKRRLAFGQQISLFFLLILILIVALYRFLCLFLNYQARRGRPICICNNGGLGFFLNRIIINYFAYFLAIY